MKQITVEDCMQLKKKFDNYCETAEQHEFPILFIIDNRIQSSLDNIDKFILNQSEVRSMFRVVLRTIGEDFSEYEEEN